MGDIIEYIDIVKLIFYVIIICLALVYLIPILSIGRFRSPINILTVNVSMSCIICSIYWTIYILLQIILSDDLNNWNCVYFQYFQTVVNCQEIYALCNVSINRYCIIIYNNKYLFKTQRWVLISIGIQWLIGVVIPLPLFSIIGQSCGQLHETIWLRCYILLIVIIIPSSFVELIYFTKENIESFFLYINGTILVYAHSSRRRVAPSNNNENILSNNRDIRLAKRMFILLFIFLIGWCPVYILFTIQNSYSFSVELLKFLAQLSLFGEIINLFVFNRKLRIYLKEKFLYYMNIFINFVQ